MGITIGKINWTVAQLGATQTVRPSTIKQIERLARFAHEVNRIVNRGLGQAAFPLGEQVYLRCGELCAYMQYGHLDLPRLQVEEATVGEVRVDFDKSFMRCLFGEDTRALSHLIPVFAVGEYFIIADPTIAQYAKRAKDCINRLQPLEQEPSASQAMGDEPLTNLDYRRRLVSLADYIETHLLLIVAGKDNYQAELRQALSFLFGDITNCQLIGFGEKHPILSVVVLPALPICNALLNPLYETQRWEDAEPHQFYDWKHEV